MSTLDPNIVLVAIIGIVVPIITLVLKFIQDRRLAAALLERGAAVDKKLTVISDAAVKTEEHTQITRSAAAATAEMVKQVEHSVNSEREHMRQRLDEAIAALAETRQYVVRLEERLRSQNT